VALEPHVLHTCPAAGFTIAGSRKLVVSYADDIKLLCKTELELQQVFNCVSAFLHKLGLVCAPSKCKPMVIGNNLTSINLGGI
jgi:hypothetical protein